MALVFAGIYVGSRHDAQNLDFLREKDIGFVLDVCGLGQPGDELHRRYQAAQIVRKICPLEDSVDFPLLPYLEECHKFIDEAQSKFKNGMPRARILVHCYEGRSRSMAVCVTYGKRFSVCKTWGKAQRWMASKMQSENFMSPVFESQIKQYFHPEQELQLRATKRRLEAPPPTPPKEKTADEKEREQLLGEIRKRIRVLDNGNLKSVLEFVQARMATVPTTSTTSAPTATDNNAMEISDIASSSSESSFSTDSFSQPPTMQMSSQPMSSQSSSIPPLSPA